MHSYHAYGFGIHSEFCIPRLLEQQGTFDIEIRSGKLADFFQPLANGKRSSKAIEPEIIHAYENIASFIVRNGNEIIIDIHPNIDKRIIFMFLLGQVFGSLLHQRGLLVLHGSAVAACGGTVAFLGPSGSGKSTLTAALMAKGYSAVTDDLVAIDVKDDTPIVYPAFPQLKLWPDAAETLGYDLSTLPNVRPNMSKRIVDSEFSSDPLQLKRIYLLEVGETISINQIPQRESMLELVRNSYAKKALHVGTHISSHFARCAKVAKDIPICRLARPKDLKSLPDLVHAVECDMRYARG